ncbi:MAG: amidohydrolase [Maricaulaceae bacterium]
MKILKFTTIFVASLIVFGCQSPASNHTDPAQTIYFGGDIVTMRGAVPEYVEAVVEQDGRIIFVGAEAEAFRLYDKTAALSDLKGDTLLPGFIDGHGHVYMTGFMSLFANILPPPDGPASDFDSLIETTQAWVDTDNGQYIIEKFGWIIGNGYDDSQLAEKDHPAAYILDRISTEYPVLVIHQSGHLASVNSKALEIIGYTKETENPAGGIIRRDDDGTPTGVLEETAFFNAIMPILMVNDPELMAKAIQKGQEEYAKNGYTTAQDGRTTPDASLAFATAARKDRLFIDVVSYPDIIWNSKAVTPEFYSDERRYNNHYRVGGVKLTLDGSPQGKTAWLSHPYHVPPTGQANDYVGYPIMSAEDATKHVTTAFENRWQILCHANGDAAIDQYITALKAAQNIHDYDDHRTVLIHGQTLRKDQIPELVVLGVHPSLFPMHTFYWGDWHAESVLGQERANYISPTRDVIDAGLTITSHHDAPVTFPNSMRVLDATVNRVTRSGKVLGPNQRLTPYEGLKTLTEWAAIQYYEEDRKGTLTEGKLADFVILSANPLKVDSRDIKDIKIITTLKEGDIVYNRTH